MLATTFETGATRPEATKKPPVVRDGTSDAGDLFKTLIY